MTDGDTQRVMSPRQTRARSEAAQFWTWDVVLYVRMDSRLHPSSLVCPLATSLRIRAPTPPPPPVAAGATIAGRVGPMAWARAAAHRRAVPGPATPGPRAGAGGGGRAPLLRGAASDKAEG